MQQVRVRERQEGAEVSVPEVRNGQRLFMATGEHQRQVQGPTAIPATGDGAVPKKLVSAAAVAERVGSNIRIRIDNKKRQARVQRKEYLTNRHLRLLDQRTGTMATTKPDVAEAGGPDGREGPAQENTCRGERDPETPRQKRIGPFPDSFRQRLRRK